MNSNYAKLFLLGMLMLSIPPTINSQGTSGVSSVQQQDLQYVCPMDPEVKSKTPGTCPKCGMTLKQQPPTSPAPVRFSYDHLAAYDALGRKLLSQCHADDPGRQNRSLLR